MNGGVHPLDAAHVQLDDSAYREGRGCYTTARVTSGRVRSLERHLARLTRGAAALALGDFDPSEARSAFEALATAAFGAEDGILRFQLSRGDQDRACLTGSARGLGDDPPYWKAITAPLAHPGALLPGGHKLTQRLPMALAQDAARRAGADEALFYDASGHLVEAARSNVLVVADDGVLCTPPEHRGAVAGIALEILIEAIPEIERRELSAAQVAQASCLLCSNAVRGVRPIIALDGVSVGSSTHPWLDRCNNALGHD